VKIGFEAPERVADILTMLNRGGNWRLTLVRPDGPLLGHLQGGTDIRSLTRGNAPSERFLIVNGDVDEMETLFAAEAVESATAFLYGCFLIAFGGRPLEEIQEELQHRPEQQIY
jgi:hypothetical protein